LGTRWLGKSSKGKRKAIFVSDLKDLIYITPLVLLILAVAALIEGNITGKLACLLAGACP
jgi:hypothetical protein